MKHIILVTLFLVALLFSSELIAGTLTDPRDGQTYRTVKIGGLEWMAENLNFKTEDSFDDKIVSVCYYGNPKMCELYGLLYTPGAGAKACPSGWHLPSYDEFNSLTEAAGGNDVAGRTLRARSDLWDDGQVGTDDLGFAALPGGADVLGMDYTDTHTGKFAGFLGAEPAIIEDIDGSVVDTLPSYLGIWYDCDHLVDGNPFLELFSIRCVKD